MSKNVKSSAYMKHSNDKQQMRRPSLFGNDDDLGKSKKTSEWSKAFHGEPSELDNFDFTKEFGGKSIKKPKPKSVFRDDDYDDFYDDPSVIAAPPSALPENQPKDSPPPAVVDEGSPPPPIVGQPLPSATQLAPSSYTQDVAREEEEVRHIALAIAENYARTEDVILVDDIGNRQRGFKGIYLKPALKESSSSEFLE